MYVGASSPELQNRLLGSILSGRRRLRLIFYLFTSFSLLFIFTCVFRLREEQFFPEGLPWAPEHGSPSSHSPFRRHPIDHLVGESKVIQVKRLAERPLSLKAAASQYRIRRGRHPPPGFEEWYKYAERNDAVIVESFFDRIYKDVAPLWGIDPRALVHQASGQGESTITYRNGSVVEKEAGYNCGTNLKNLMDEVAMHIPDLDMPINCYDESRLLIPWETTSKLVAVERENRAIVSRNEVIVKYTGLGNLTAGSTQQYNPPLILHGNNWDIVRETCPPDSLSRNTAQPTNFSTPAVLGENWTTAHSYRGFVKNATAAMDFCTQPHLAGMHASLFEPATLMVSKEMYPLFGGGKLLRASELLIPDFAYLERDEDSMYTGGAEHGSWWEAKLDGIAWRGSPTGPSLATQRWRRMQRARLVEMLNGTTVAGMENHLADAQTFTLPPASLYNFPRRRQGTVGKWLQTFADVGFTGVDWAGEIFDHFNASERKSMSSQYQYKFIPDVDGNGFSGRYRSLLRSSSVPLKATLYAEWHDDRLLPWLHYVPVDNTFQDIHAILDYFTSDKHGDDSARNIAEEGQKWADRVLRRQDMLLYVWRLLLEFARVCDQSREMLGYIGDLD